MQVLAGIYQQGESKTEGGAKNQKGGRILNIQTWMFVATEGLTVKWGVTDFKWGWPFPPGDPACDGPAQMANTMCK